MIAAAKTGTNDLRISHHLASLATQSAVAEAVFAATSSIGVMVHPLLCRTSFDTEGCIGPPSRRGRPLPNCRQVSGFRWSLGTGWRTLGSRLANRRRAGGTDPRLRWPGASSAWTYPGPVSLDLSASPHRYHLIAAAATVVVAGVSVTGLGHGSISSAIGDALYAALVYLLVAFVAPRSRTRFVAAMALGLCIAVELTQLTGASAAVVEWWGPAHYLLGTTFQAVDLAAYAAGVAVSALVDRGRSTQPVTTTSLHVGA